MQLSMEMLEAFSQNLNREEKSEATRKKYLRDARAFLAFAGGEELSKETVVAWKKSLIGRGYTVASVNSMLASINSWLDYLELPGYKVKNIRVQRQTYCSEDKELTKAEYMRLLAAARKDRRLNLMLQTICGTGIRVSELRYFTVDSVSRGEIVIQCKGKNRTILVPGRLRSMLLKYARAHGISDGTIFLGKTGKPLDRSCIWRMMKNLCCAANVKATKVFPHNLRKLFARTFYGIEKDIAKLADILGHSSINTTRIYIMTTGSEHRRQLERLGLVL